METVLSDMEKETQRLWIVTELFPPDETSTSYVMGEIANAMARKYDVGVICGPEVYDKRKQMDPDSSFILDPSITLYRAKDTGLDKNTARGKALTFLVMSRAMIELSKRHIRKGDKVLMVTNPAPLVVLMSRLKKKVGFELTVLVHDVFPENTRAANIRLPMYGLVKRVFDKAYSQADHLIAIGRDMKEVLARKAGKGPKISIIENWADVDSIRPKPFPEGRIVLQYAGNIGRVQGLDKVIAFMTDDVELHIYGTGAMEESLKKLNHPRVFFHGPYYRSQQNEVLAACDVAVVSLQDGMFGLGVPSKTYNILASGRPVLYLGPSGSEIDLLVREKGIGYCGWPEVWNRNELQSMGARAREIAEKEYSKSVILQKFVDAL